jgi:hypothetical protein
MCSILNIQPWPLRHSCKRVWRPPKSLFNLNCIEIKFVLLDVVSLLLYSDLEQLSLYTFNFLSVLLITMNSDDNFKLITGNLDVPQITTIIK